MEIASCGTDRIDHERRAWPFPTVDMMKIWAPGMLIHFRGLMEAITRSAILDASQEKSTWYKQLSCTSLPLTKTVTGMTFSFMASTNDCLQDEQRRSLCVSLCLESFPTQWYLETTDIPHPPFMCLLSSLIAALISLTVRFIISRTCFLI